MDRADKILIAAEHREGQLRPVSWEAIALGQQIAAVLGCRPAIVLIGSGVEQLANEVAHNCGEEVLWVENKQCQEFSPEAWCAVWLELVLRQTPRLVLMGHTYQTLDFAPRLAARLDRPMLSGCVGFEVTLGEVEFVRPVYEGRLHQRVRSEGDPPAFVSIQPGAFAMLPLGQGRRPSTVLLEVPIPEGTVTRRVLSLVPPEELQVELGQAEIVVAGGRGLESNEKFQLVDDLAKALGAAVGASRPAVDNGWVSKAHQIGSSGQTIAPRLYVACGISGAIHHVVGVLGARSIVAINKDPSAPIFRQADFGIVGDVFDVVPALIQELQSEESA